MHDVQSCSYTGRRPLDSLSDIRAAHHSGVPCVEIIPISTSHDTYKLSFLPRTIIVWNQLPSIIITAPSLGAYSVRDSSLVSHNPSTQLALVQRTHNRTVHYSSALVRPTSRVPIVGKSSVCLIYMKYRIIILIIIIINLCQILLSYIENTSRTHARMHAHAHTHACTYTVEPLVSAVRWVGGVQP